LISICILENTALFFSSLTGHLINTMRTRHFSHAPTIYMFKF
jgi:hypothetical protein